MTRKRNFLCNRRQICDSSYKTFLLISTFSLSIPPSAICYKYHNLHHHLKNFAHILVLFTDSIHKGDIALKKTLLVPFLKLKILEVQNGIKALKVTIIKVNKKYNKSYNKSIKRYKSGYGYFGIHRAF